MAKGLIYRLWCIKGVAAWLTAPKLFSQTGEMRYNNYINRYHDRHTDLMVKLAMSSTSQKTRCRRILMRLCEQASVGRLRCGAYGASRGMG